MRGFDLLLILSILAVACLASSDSDAVEPAWTMQFDMVCPTGSEGFTLVNNTFDDADLREYTVTDGEGTISFRDRIIVTAFETVTVLASEPEPWMLIDSPLIVGTNGIIMTGRFNLADGGDDIRLERNGVVLDSFAWGSAYTDGWDGDGLDRIPKRAFASRNHAYGEPGETEVWRTYIPGMTLYHFTRTYEDCVVTPFSFPESDGGEIIHAIQDAEETVDISIYTISHPGIASVLAHLLDKEVRVRILIEGSPAGGIPAEEIRMLTSLWKKGADIHIIKSNDSYKRYAYVHSKYAVVDGSTSIITSENWTENSFSSNRGWGAIIEDVGCAEYLTVFFERDFDSDMLDIIEFRSAYPTATSMRIGHFEPVMDTFDSYIADVTTAIAPDYSWKTLMDFISSAEERLYSQQLYVEYSWTGGGCNPLTEMERLGLGGVDCRLLVDVTYDDPFDSEYEDGYGICAFYEDSEHLKVRYVDGRGFSMSHNKGIICDDRVWVGSMNWTENSIRNNREVSVIIDSKEVADFFAERFCDDWGVEFMGEVVLDVRISKASYGGPTELDASDSLVPQGSVFEWDLDGDGEVERRGLTASWRFYEDADCLLMVTDPDGVIHTHRFTVRASGESEEQKPLLSGPLKYVPLILLCAILIVMKRLKVSGAR